MRLVFVIAFLVIAWALASRGEAKKPGVVILCEMGGVGRLGDDISALGAGFKCVGHDAQGGAFSADSIAIYDNGVTGP